MTRPMLQRTEALKEHILSGQEPKRFASDYGLSIQRVCEIVWSLGFKRRYVTEAEWEALLKQRKGK